MAPTMLVLFGRTDVCEQTFGVMSTNKAPHTSQLSEGHLRSVLRIATTKLPPEFDVLAKKGWSTTLFPLKVNAFFLCLCWICIHLLKFLAKKFAHPRAETLCIGHDSS